VAIALQLTYIGMRTGYVVYIFEHPIELPSSQYEAVVEESAARLTIILFVNMLAIFVTIARMFKFFEFQPRMNIIARTVSNSANDMFHFFVLFFSIFLAFGFLSYLLYGPHLEEFNDVGRSLQSIGEFMLGEFDFQRLKSVDAVLASLLFWFFVLVVFFTMVNVFLAILIDAYAEAKSGMETASSIPTDLVQIFRQSRGVKPDFLIAAIQYFKARGVSRVFATDIRWYLRVVQGMSPEDAKFQLKMFLSLPGKESVAEVKETTINQLLRSSWTRYDRNDSGSLNRAEFEKMVESLPFAGDLLRPELFDEVDANRSGQIDYDEFCLFFNKILLRSLGLHAKTFEGDVDEPESPGIQHQMSPQASADFVMPSQANATPPPTERLPEAPRFLPEFSGPKVMHSPDQLAFAPVPVDIMGLPVRSVNPLMPSPNPQANGNGNGNGNGVYSQPNMVPTEPTRDPVRHATVGEGVLCYF